MAGAGTAGAFDRATLERLIALGRARGSLGPDDLRAAVPVDAMDVDDLVLLILELEEAGVSVEPEAFGPQRGVETALRLPRADPGVPAASAARVAADAPAAVDRENAGAQPYPVPSQRADDDGQSIDRVVALAGLAAFLAIAGAILLL